MKSPLQQRAAEPEAMILKPALAEILTTSCPTQKTTAARAVIAQWQAMQLQNEEVLAQDWSSPWPEPAQRSRPPLAPPGTMARRGLGSISGRQALLHAVAHIELNAVDLAIDIVGRFAEHLPALLQSAFIADWLSVADDEARHFTMVAKRLEQLGGCYGDLPAHDGLWQAAQRTQTDLLARLAIAPMVLEARGLDVTPGMITKLEQARDTESAEVLGTIYRDEIGHVAKGTKWFRLLCQKQGRCPEESFAQMIADHFPAGLKKPFNYDARDQSNFPRDWYEDLAET